MTTAAPYGSWKSPITSELIVAETIGISQVAFDGSDVYWIESRPAEGGRYVVVRRTPDGTIADVTPPPFNARTRVHEYGGGDFIVADGTVYFSNFSDQRLYRQDPNSKPRPIAGGEGRRYADGVVDRRRGRLIYVCEDHGGGRAEPENYLIALDPEGEEEGQALVSGDDFYSSPRLSPDGLRLAWLSWNHPNMPWDGTELWVGELDETGAVVRRERVAGGPEVSVFQPEWSPDGALYFIDDRSGWWNLYGRRDGKVEPVCPRPAEFGLPQWVFGLSTYGFVSSSSILCAFLQSNWKLASLDTVTGKLDLLKIPYTEVSYLRTAPGRAAFIGGSPVEPRSVVDLSLATGERKVLRRSTGMRIDEGYLSIPEAIEFPTEGAVTAHGLFYRPRSRDFSAPAGERPPLLVMIHGGPTASASGTFNLVIQYWTSRGFAVLDVNYGGSTGYGREYRRRLEGRWGIVDVDDCVNGARYLTLRGEVDGERLAIRGGSAGGYTTLAALTFRDLFKAGASHYGVSDLEALARDTHKFESRYLDRLIGPYPERTDLYRERSPIHFLERLRRPVIFFQGLEDKIVPPDQAEKMVNALRERGVPVAYVPFAGEQHGFRRAENIKRALDGELFFYSRVFGFGLAEPVEPVEIENL